MVDTGITLSAASENEQSGRLAVCLLHLQTDPVGVFSRLADTGNGVATLSGVASPETAKVNVQPRRSGIMSRATIIVVRGWDMSSRRVDSMLDGYFQAERKKLFCSLEIIVGYLITQLKNGLGIQHELFVLLGKGKLSQVIKMGVGLG